MSVEVIGVAASDSVEEWVCVQEDCDGEHHYYKKMHVVEVRLS